MPDTKNKSHSTDTEESGEFEIINGTFDSSSDHSNAKDQGESPQPEAGSDQHSDREKKPNPANVDLSNASSSSCGFAQDLHREQNIPKANDKESLQRQRGDRPRNTVPRSGRDQTSSIVPSTVPQFLSVFLQTLMQRPVPPSYLPHCKQNISRTKDEQTQHRQQNDNFSLCNDLGQFDSSRDHSSANNRGEIPQSEVRSDHLSNHETQPNPVNIGFSTASGSNRRFAQNHHREQNIPGANEEETQHRQQNNAFAQRENQPRHFEIRFSGDRTSLIFLSIAPLLRACFVPILLRCLALASYLPTLAQRLILLALIFSKWI